jgi:hypothetical protein
MHTIVKKALVVMALVSLVAVSANAAYYGAPIRLRTHYNTLRADVDCKDVFKSGVYLSEGQLVSNVTSKVTSTVTSHPTSRSTSHTSSRVSSKVTSKVALPARLQYAIKKACKL